MRYLNGTMSYGIHYSGHPAVLEGYSDSNWISDADELYATSGYAFTLRGGAPDGNGAPKPANPTGTRLKWGGFGENLDPPGLMGQVWGWQTRTHRPADPR